MATLPSYIEFKDIRRWDGRHLLVCHAGFSRSSDGSLETANRSKSRTRRFFGAAVTISTIMKWCSR